MITLNRLNTSVAALALALVVPQASADQVKMRVDAGIAGTTIATTQGFNTVNHSGGNYFAEVIDTGTSPDLNGVLANYASVAKGNALSNYALWTFCIEINESFSGGGIYNVSLSNSADNGGYSGGNPDPISVATARLYSLFATGQMSSLVGGFVYDASHGADVQEAIWYLEGEDSVLNRTGANSIIAALGAPSFNSTINYTGSAVRVMNLTDSAGNKKQSQLVYVGVPDGGTSLLLLGLGLAGLNVLSRRRR